MPSYVPAKKNTGYVFYVSLISQADTKLMQANPTLAAGDVKVATDDAAPANLGALPTVDGDFTKRVKVTLSAAEMNGDNITVIFSDASGAEWCDLTINIQTTARQIDDLAPESGGNVAAIKAKTDNLAFTTANKVDSRVDYVGATSVSGPNDLKADVSNLDAAVSTRAPESGGNVAAIKAKTDNLPSGIAKNVALNNFEFVMVDSTDHVTPKTGLTVTCQISLDGGAYQDSTNSAVEVGAGTYKIDFTQAERNATVGSYKFSASGADTRIITIVSPI